MNIVKPLKEDFMLKKGQKAKIITEIFKFYVKYFLS